MRGWLKKLLGDRGERAAARFLRRQGLKILARQCSSRLGEIDVIARDGDCVVFVEVKTRRSSAAGDPVEAVTFGKQKQLTRVALSWLKSRGLLEHRARFDIVAVLWPEGARKPEIRHYRNAFEPIGVEGMFS
ncbi:MAG: YraN family protein [Planctomycetes bacterium]|nr:YraN family protein [Planctomycetota bacterium]